jgi:hypothetical protein
MKASVGRVTTWQLEAAALSCPAGSFGDRRGYNALLVSVEDSI